MDRTLHISGHFHLGYSPFPCGLQLLSPVTSDTSSLRSVLSPSRTIEHSKKKTAFKLDSHELLANSLN